MIGGWGIFGEIALRWMPLDLTDDKSTLAQVMAWCRQATSHYLSQCWPRALSPYGVTRPQWVKLKRNENFNYMDTSSHKVNSIYHIPQILDIHKCGTDAMEIFCGLHTTSTYIYRAQPLQPTIPHYAADAACNAQGHYRWLGWTSLWHLLLRKLTRD